MVGEAAAAPLPTGAAGDLTVPGRTLEEIADAALAAAPPAPEPDTQGGGLVLQDFTPLSECLEAELSGRYWREAGVRAFSGSAVPFVVNNSGRLSECASQVLFGHCLEMEPQGTIDLLELGAGCGLFALYLLDAFRAVCERQGRDYYGRLRYHVTDGSAETVAAWVRQDQFAEHADRVVLGACDATGPLALKHLDGTSVPLPPMRAVFANYLLDSLPAAVVRQGAAGPEQLCVRTSLADPEELARLHPGVTLEALARMAASQDPAVRAGLLPYLGLFEYAASYEPLRPDGLPFLSAALALDGASGRTLLNHGALGCLERCAGLVGGTGFVLVADYGPATPDRVAGEAVPSRFGDSSAFGVNFPLLEAVAAGTGLSATAPDGDAGSPVHVRLLARAPLPLTRATLADRYSGGTREAMEAPMELARRSATLGDVQGALAAYGHALRLNRQNWTVMAEMGRFMHEHGLDGALDVARHAVRKNPWYAPSLWVLLGDVLFKADDVAGARAAFEEARRLDPADVAACHGLSYVDAAEGRYRDAVELAVAGLLADRRGAARDALMAHLGNLLSTLSAQVAAAELRMLRRAQAFETAG